MKKQIIIYLGNKCNLNCLYCHRDNLNECNLSPSFLEELSFFNGNIIFRGGEPTLYMDIINVIVNEAKLASFTITTNGILLDKYKDFFLNHNFEIYISYDGTNIRKYDPFTKIIEYPNINATSILTKESNIYNILKKFDEKSIITNHRLYFYPHIMHYTNSINEQFAMTNKDYQRISKQLKDCMLKFITDKKKFNMTNHRYLGIHNFFLNAYEKNYEFGETQCTNKYTKRVDLTGQEYNCLYIRNTKLSADWLQTQQELISSLFPKCVKCPVYDMCGAGCVKSLYHDRECKFYYDIFTWYKKFYAKYKLYLK